MGVPVVLPSYTPERISTRSASCRCVTWRLVPGRRRSRSGWMSASDKAMPGGQPSITQPIAGPCDSPKFVTAKRKPKVLPLMSAIISRARECFLLAVVQRPSGAQGESMLDRTTTRFSHVKPGDTDYVSGGLRDFFLYRDLGVAQATHGKVIAHLVKANLAPEQGTGWHRHEADFQIVIM